MKKLFLCIAAMAVHASLAIAAIGATAFPVIKGKGKEVP